MYLHPVGQHYCHCKLKLAVYSIYIVKPLSDCKQVFLQIHNSAGEHAHATAHGHPVNHPDQSLDHLQLVKWNLQQNWEQSRQFGRPLVQQQMKTGRSRVKDEAIFCLCQRTVMVKGSNALKFAVSFEESPPVAVYIN